MSAKNLGVVFGRECLSTCAASHVPAMKLTFTLYLESFSDTDALGRSVARVWGHGREGARDRLARRACRSGVQSGATSVGSLTFISLPFRTLDPHILLLHKLPLSG
jgi:hypothetical protein